MPWTPGEVKALIAPLFNTCAEDIDDIVIVIKGKCKCCSDRDGFSMTTNCLSTKDTLNLLNEAIVAKIMESE